MCSYNPELEVLPDNPHTWVSVVSPAALKWQYPVGQATFNPRSWPGDTSDVVFAEFTPDCRGSTYEQCQACWEAGDIFSNRAAMVRGAHTRPRPAPPTLAPARLPLTVAVCCVCRALR